MNHPHDPLFRWLSLVIALYIGVAIGGWAFPGVPKPAPAPTTESQLVRTDGDGNRAWAAIWSAAAKICPYIKTAPPQTILPVELEACLDRLVPPPSNREGQTPTVSPQPYVLHPDKTPLSDPTQADYYRKLLEQGRFPTSGAAEGRPR